MKKRHLPITLICFLFVSHTLFAQGLTVLDTAKATIKTPVADKGTIKGIVTDDEGKPVIGATIFYDDNIGGAVTDIDGKYELSIAAGRHDLEVHSLGFDTTYTSVRVIAHKTIEADVQMQKTEQAIGLVTVTGNKYATKFGADPVSVEVLKPEFIENSGSVDLNKALDKVPGVNMIGEQVNIRGGAGYAAGSASRVLMLMDGLPLLTPDDGTIEFSSLPMENVEQVEIIKGAASALYGSSAINGIINLITANPKNDTTYNKLTTFWGIYENPFKGKESHLYWTNKRPMFGGANFSHRKRYKNLDLVIGGGYYQDKSYLAANATKRARLNIKLRHICPKVPGLSVGLNANFANTDGQYFFLWKFWTKNNPDSLNSKTYKGMGQAYVPSDTGTFRNTPISVDPFITYFDNHGNQHSFKGRWYFVNSLNSGGQTSYAQLLYGEYNFHRDLKFLGISFVTGLVGTYTHVESQQFGDVNGRNGALFVQFDKKLAQNRLTLSLGERTEVIQLADAKAVVVPVMRAGANYQLSKGTFFRASFGQGYRYPTIAEKYVSTVRGGIPVVPNPALQPESSWSGELGVKQAIPVAKNWIAYIDLAGFVTQYKNMIEFNPIIIPSGQLAFQAQNDTFLARISGFELSALGQGKIFSYPLNFLIGYTYLNPINLNFDKAHSLQTSNFLNYRYRHSVKADIESTVKHVILGVSITYVSFMENVAPEIEAVNGIGAYRAANHHGTYVMDARLGYSISDGTRISLIAKNLLNEQYSSRPGYFEAPRNYTVQLSYQF